jgi:hypothetical protein
MTHHLQTFKSFMHTLFLCVALHWTFNFLHQSIHLSSAAISLLQSIVQSMVQSMVQSIVQSTVQSTQLYEATVSLGQGGMAKNFVVLRFCFQNVLYVN